MPFFRSFDGVKIHYETRGSGRPLIFLHGIPGRALNWSRVIKALKGDFLTITLDFRGYGSSEKPEIFTMLDHVKDVKCLIQELGINPNNLVLIGHSYGTMIALMFCSSSSIGGMILVSPPLELKKDFTDFMILHFPSWIWKPLLFSNNPLTRKLYKKIFFSSSTPDKVYEEFVKENAEYIESLPPQSFKNPSTFEYRAKDYAPRVKTKVAVIVGEDDRVTPPTEAKRVAELLNGIFIELSNAGHMLLYERPDTLARIIQEFCKGLSGVGK
ncbi:alpha/beta fold hydrolase [Thermococcus sp.]